MASTLIDGLAIGTFAVCWTPVVLVSAATWSAITFYVCPKPVVFLLHAVSLKIGSEIESKVIMSCCLSVQCVSYVQHGML